MRPEVCVEPRASAGIGGGATAEGACGAAGTIRLDRGATGLVRPARTCALALVGGHMGLPRAQPLPALRSRLAHGGPPPRDRAPLVRLRRAGRRRGPGLAGRGHRLSPGPARREPPRLGDRCHRGGRRPLGRGDQAALARPATHRCVGPSRGLPRRARGADRSHRARRGTPSARRQSPTARAGRLTEAGRRDRGSIRSAVSAASAMTAATTRHTTAKESGPRSVPRRATSRATPSARPT